MTEHSSSGSMGLSTRWRRPWIDLAERRVTGFFPRMGVSKGDVVLVFPREHEDCCAADGVRCRVTRVDDERNRIKARPTT